MEHIINYNRQVYLACYFFVYRRFLMQKQEFIKERYLFELLGGKWRISIIEDLFSGTKQFHELKSNVTGISSKVLNDNLQYLIKHGIVTKATYPSYPTKVKYSLTARGRNIRSILDSIYQWSIENYMPPIEEVKDEYYKIFEINP